MCSTLCDFQIAYRSRLHFRVKPSMSAISDIMDITTCLSHAPASLSTPASHPQTRPPHPLVYLHTYISSLRSLLKLPSRPVPPKSSELFLDALYIPEKAERGFEWGGGRGGERGGKSERRDEGGRGVLERGAGEGGV